MILFPFYRLRRRNEGRVILGRVAPPTVSKALPLYLSHTAGPTAAGAECNWNRLSQVPLHLMPPSGLDDSASQ